MTRSLWQSPLPLSVKTLFRLKRKWDTRTFVTILYGSLLQSSTVSDFLMIRDHFQESCPRLVRRAYNNEKQMLRFDENSGVVSNSDYARYVSMGNQVLQTNFVLDELYIDYGSIYNFMEVICLFVTCNNTNLWFFKSTSLYRINVFVLHGSLREIRLICN